MKTEIVKKIEKPITKIFVLISSLTSYTSAVAIMSAAIGGVIATLFALYFFDAVGIQVSNLTNTLLKVCILFAWTFSSIQFGLLVQLGFKGSLGKVIKTVNKYISVNPIQIKKGLSLNEYRELLSALNKLPGNITLTVNVNIALIVLLIVSSEIITLSLTLTKFILILIVGGIAAFIVTCFTMIISEVLTGNMRERCLQYIHKTGNPFYFSKEEKKYSTVRTKLLYFVILFIITLFISNTIIYMNRTDISKAISFAIFAIIVSLYMMFLIFYMIYSSLKQIEVSSYEIIKKEGDLLFFKYLDEEFINLARALNEASMTIREYQTNLESKVEERTQELNQTVSQLAAKDKMIETELEFAANIQKGILPSASQMSPWNGISFSAYYRPMGKVSGDYYDIFRRKEELYILMADASGHGVPAALVTMTAKQAFSTAIETNQELVDILKDVNNTLVDKIKTSDYMTVFLLKIDDNHKVTYSNASHPRAIHFIQSRGEYQLLDSDGMFVGAIEDAHLFYQEKQTRMQSGDRIYLFTDGVLEHRNILGEEFGLDRAIETLSSTRYMALDNQIANLVDTLKRFIGDAPIKDDISVFALELQASWSKFIELYNSGIKFLKNNKVTDALQHFLEAKNLFPAQIILQYQMALVYYQQGDYIQAEKYILAYLKEKEEELKGLQLAVNIYLKLGNKKEAKLLMDKIKLSEEKKEN